jgi:N-acetyl-gamma-glutamyl-phosphate reductase
MRAHNVFAYSVLGHRHEAEVLMRWREWRGDTAAAVRLMTHSGPFVRGIYLTLHAWLRGENGRERARMGEKTISARFSDAYAARPFVRLLEQPPELTHAVGTNHALIHVAEADDEVQVMVAIDNLVKGAGGQAIQAMNLALGIPETAGLLGGGMYPC